MKHYKINKAKFIYFILLIIKIVFLVWLWLSWCEVLVKNTNTSGNIIYSNWNLFALILNHF